MASKDDCFGSNSFGLLNGEDIVCPVCGSKWLHSENKVVPVHKGEWRARTSR